MNTFLNRRSFLATGGALGAATLAACAPNAAPAPAPAVAPAQTQPSGAAKAAWEQERDALVVNPSIAAEPGKKCLWTSGNPAMVDEIDKSKKIGAELAGLQ